MSPAAESPIRIQRIWCLSVRQTRRHPAVCINWDPGLALLRAYHPRVSTRAGGERGNNLGKAVVVVVVAAAAVVVVYFQTTHNKEYTHITMKKYAVCGNLPEPEAVNCVEDCLGGINRLIISEFNGTSTPKGSYSAKSSSSGGGGWVGESGL